VGPSHAIDVRGRTLGSLLAAGLVVAVIASLAGPAQAAPGQTHAAAAAGVARAQLLGRPALLASIERVAARRSAQQQRAERRSAARRQAGQKAQAQAQVRNAAGEPLAITGQACEDNLALAAKQGLLLPDGWEIHCVGPGLDYDGVSHWGVTCSYASCPEGAGPYVSISNPTYYVVAHELCHANFGNDELMADSCAAEHGASLATSPYQ
jgi:hypothetical protein